MDYDSYLSPFSLRFFFKELLIITFSYNLQLILFLVSACISVPYFIVATNQQSQIVGFSSITHQGYLHSMFVHKDFQGKGIATILLNEIERYATTRGIMRITSEVSLTARPFFEKRGYIVEVEQKRKANQLYLTNFWMEKRLAE